MKNLRYDEDSETPAEESCDQNLDGEEKDSNGFAKRTTKSPEVRFSCKLPGFSCI